MKTDESAEHRANAPSPIEVARGRNTEAREVHRKNARGSIDRAAGNEMLEMAEASGKSMAEMKRNYAGYVASHGEFGRPKA